MIELFRSLPVAVATETFVYADAGSQRLLLDGVGAARLRYPVAYPATVLPLRRLTSDGLCRPVVKSSYGL